MSHSSERFHMLSLDILVLVLLACHHLGGAFRQVHKICDVLQEFEKCLAIGWLLEEALFATLQVKPHQLTIFFDLCRMVPQRFEQTTALNESQTFYKIHWSDNKTIQKHWNCELSCMASKQAGEACNMVCQVSI